MKWCRICKVSYPSHHAVCAVDASVLTEVWPEGTVVRGKYQILAQVGEGVIGFVYKAQHLKLGEPRALKVMRQELAADPDFVRRFESEAVNTRRLNHPNAVQVDDLDHADDGSPFIAMEFISGVSLRGVMRTMQVMPVERVCAIASQVAAALGAAHNLGMVHRDINPDNIALVQTPDGEVAKVLDFGIANVKEGSDLPPRTQTMVGWVYGNPNYVSPEQAEGKRGDGLDGRADLYSLGVTMYEMLTGVLPLTARSPIEMLFAHVFNPPTDIREYRSDIPVPVADLVMSCLEKQAGPRPQNGQEFAQAITQAIEKLNRGAIRTQPAVSGRAQESYPSLTAYGPSAGAPQPQITPPAAENAPEVPTLLEPSPPPTPVLVFAPAKGAYPHPSEVPALLEPSPPPTLAPVFAPPKSTDSNPPDVPALPELSQPMPAAVFAPAKDAGLLPPDVPALPELSQPMPAAVFAPAKDAGLLPPDVPALLEPSPPPTLPPVFAPPESTDSNPPDPPASLEPSLPPTLTPVFAPPESTDSNPPDVPALPELSQPMPAPVFAPAKGADPHPPDVPASLGPSLPPTLTPVFAPPKSTDSNLPDVPALPELSQPAPALGFAPAKGAGLLPPDVPMPPPADARHVAAGYLPGDSSASHPSTQPHARRRLILMGVAIGLLSIAIYLHLPRNAVPNTFNLTVRALAPDGTPLIINSGKVTIDLGKRFPTAHFGDQGIAEFQGLPLSVQGQTIRLRPDVPQYETPKNEGEWEEHRIANGVVNLVLERMMPPLSVSTGPTLTSGVANNFYRQELMATGGTAPYSWSITQGAVPGLNLDAGTGLLSGTPTASKQYQLEVKVSDASGLSATKVVDLKVLPGSMIIATGWEPDVYLGTRILHTFTATGGTGAYRWSVEGGGVPGLQLDPATGTFFGTPTRAGLYRILVEARDPSGASVIQPFQVKVRWLVVEDTVTVTPRRTSPGPVGKSSIRPLEAEHGTPPNTVNLPGDRVVGRARDRAALQGLPLSATPIVIPAAAEPISVPLPEFVLDRTLNGHSGWVTGVAFSADGRRLASGGWDQAVKLWDVATGQELGGMDSDMKRIQALAFSHDGHFLAAESATNAVALWDAATGRELRTLPGHQRLGLLDAGSWVYSIAFSPDSRWLASGVDDKTVRLWEVKTGDPVHDLSGLPRSVICMAFSPDGRWLATGDGDRSIEIWEVATGREIRKLKGHKKDIYAVAFSPNGRWLASASGDKSVKLWDVATGREVRSLESHRNLVTSIAFSPDGRWLASGSWDKTVKIWDVATGRELQTLAGHTHHVYTVAVDSHGRWLASGSEDGTINLWRLRRPELRN